MENISFFFFNTLFNFTNCKVEIVNVLVALTYDPSLSSVGVPVIWVSS